MQLAEYAGYDALGLAGLVRTRQVTPAELLETACTAIERTNPQLNFVAHDLTDYATDLVRSGVADGPFAGVPFGMKDLVADLEGTPLTAGSRLFGDTRSKLDSHLAARFKRAGLVPLIKTTSAEFGCYLATESGRFGITRNPWNPDRTPGGSSGGSAAAVAAGALPLAHANDGFGSIRVPASNCGLFGLKPTRQRTPTGPVFGELGGPRAVEFAVSRTVSDSAALLDCVHGPDAGAPYYAPPAPPSYFADLQRPRSGLRIALMTASFSGAPIDPACAGAAAATANACEQLGHHVEPASPEIDWPGFDQALRVEALSFMSALMTGVAEAMEKSPGADDLDRMSALIVEAGSIYSAGDYVIACESYARVQRQMGRFFERFDLLITPMLATPAAPIGWVVAPDDDVDSYWRKCCGDGYSPFAAVFNVTGQPAASVPMTHDAEGVPIGTQLVGRFGDEATVLNLARQLEQTDAWMRGFPAIHASRPAARP